MHKPPLPPGIYISFVLLANLVFFCAVQWSLNPDLYSNAHTHCLQLPDSTYQSSGRHLLRLSLPSPWPFNTLQPHLTYFPLCSMSASGFDQNLNHHIQLSIHSVCPSMTLGDTEKMKIQSALLNVKGEYLVTCCHHSNNPERPRLINYEPCFHEWVKKDEVLCENVGELWHYNCSL